MRTQFIDNVHSHRLQYHLSVALNSESLSACLTRNNIQHNELHKHIKDVLHDYFSELLACVMLNFLDLRTLTMHVFDDVDAVNRSAY